MNHGRTEAYASYQGRAQALSGAARYLKGEKTMEIIKRIEIARGFGDLSENSE